MPQRNLQDKDLAAIVQLQQEIVTASLSLEKLLQMICQRTQDLTSAAGAVVEIAEGESMVYRASSGSLESSLGLHLSIHKSLSGLSVKTDQVLVCYDSETDQRVDREACRKVGARSMICVPLTYHSTSVGVLKVVSSEADKFKDREINILRLIAGLLSASIYRAESENLLRQSEHRAIQASKAKSEFLANMSHEIRTPLTGVIGVAGLLEETPLNEQQKDYVKLIHCSAESLLTLVNDILDLSKIEARKMVIEKIDFDLRQSVGDVQQILSLAAKKKGLDFKVSIDEGLPQNVVGDPARIRQILLNLVGNAIKFTNKGFVHVRVAPVKDAVLFEVRDSGSGVSQETLEKLFHPYEQADDSTFRKFGGTGLGLSICKQLVEIMQGELGVESEEGKGSMFWFRVPLPLSEKKILRTDSLDERPLKNVNILVAEDIQVNQIIVKAMLEKMGCKVTLVNNGKEAVEALSLAFYDVVLMDCQMPELDGYEATRMIRTSGKPWANVPIVAMTANAMMGDKEKCLEAGMNDYITKPIRKNELTLAIQRSKIESSSSLNKATIQELKDIDEDGSHETLKTLIGLYLSSSPQKMNQINLLYTQKNYSALRHEAHSLRSSSLNLGAETLAQIASQIEYVKDDFAMDETIRPVLEELVHEYERVETELRSFLA